MITVRCLYSNGDVIITPINDDIDGARKYFLDQWFNLGIVEDNMQKCIKVEELHPNVIGSIRISELIKEHVKTINNNCISYHHKNNKFEVISTAHKLIAEVDTIFEAEKIAGEYNAI